MAEVVHDVLDIGGDVVDADAESLVHLGGQVLNVGDEFLHFAEDVDQLEGCA